MRFELDPSEPPSTPDSPRIAIVGPCASGKTTLAEGLHRHGYYARQIAQEHSFVPDMWQVMTKPDVLIFLDASYPVCTERKSLNWLPREYEEQQHRLRHARRNCDVYQLTDGMTPDAVLKAVLTALEGL
jgi:deoxyadenosine/deoxycytidine kinase